jgi:hypothetical protein
MKLHDNPRMDSWYSFLSDAESTPLPPAHSAAGRVRLAKKSNDLIGNRSRDLPSRSIVSKSSTLPCNPGN